MNAIKSGLSSGVTMGHTVDSINSIEGAIKRMVSIGQKISYTRLIDSLEEKYNENGKGVELAIMNMIKKEEL